MKILFVGSVCEESFFYDLIRSTEKNKPSIAGQRFEQMIVEGLQSECQVELLTYIPVGSYPSYPKLLVHKKKETLKKKSNINYIPFVNVAVLKQITIFIYSLWFLLKWAFINRNVNNKVLLLNVVYPPTALPSLILRKLFSFKAVVLVPDISSFRFHYSPTKNLVKRMLLKIFKEFSEILDRRFDGYVFLTQAMNELINHKKAPYIVLEGMIEEHLKNLKNELVHKKLPTYIMYAGNLRERYGIAKLIRAFQLMKKKEIEMWIFGSGDYEDEIEQVASRDSRIRFMGVVPHVEVMKYELQATLLINPRPSNEEFTQYSFPSKTLEYMASGTPLLTTRLPGIPEEYWEYVYTFDEESTEGMSKKLDMIISISQKELHEFGHRAREYVLEKKNHKTQATKIHELLKMMLDEEQEDRILGLGEK